MNKIDALFVINQDSNIIKLKNLVKNFNYKKIMFLTTHYMLEHERVLFNSYFNDVEYNINTFADFLTDSDMESCDNFATEICLKRNNISEFQELSLYFKNALIYKKFSYKNTFDKIYFYKDLGISLSFWSTKKESICINELKVEHSQNFLNNFFKVVKNKLNIIFYKNREINIIENKEKKYLFISSIKRLSFNKANTIIKKKKLYNLLFFILKNGLYCNYIATTIHNYYFDYPIYKKLYLKEFLVFIDGFHPSNYPRTWIDLYSNKAVFVIRNMFDHKWFEKYNRKILINSDFISNNLMKVENLKKDLKIKNIILVLNHAGDWTALINRSDTDILIEMFSNLAEHFEDINFIIRLHPTMAQEYHEGKNSINRIFEYVKFLKLKNLEISNKSLDEDLVRGDLYLSEYSQVLIDAYLNGKLGLVINLTNRRSFMQDYEKQGFLTINKVDDIVGKITDIIKNTYLYVNIQENAMLNYNQSLKEFINQCINL